MFSDLEGNSRLEVTTTHTSIPMQFSQSKHQHKIFSISHKYN